jgi:hypothetical protein
MWRRYSRSGRNAGASSGPVECCSPVSISESTTYSLPFNPLKDPELYKRCIENNDGVQFSHTVEEQLGGLLKAGFTITDLYEDTNGSGRLHEFNVPTFLAVRAVKPSLPMGTAN